MHWLGVAASGAYCSEMLATTHSMANIFQLLALRTSEAAAGVTSADSHFKSPYCDSQTEFQLRVQAEFQFLSITG